MSKLTQKAHSTIRSFNEKVGPYARSFGTGVYGAGAFIMFLGFMVILLGDPLTGIVLEFIGWSYTEFLEKLYIYKALKENINKEVCLPVFGIAKAAIEQ